MFKSHFPDPVLVKATIYLFYFLFFFKLVKPWLSADGHLSLILTVSAAEGEGAEDPDLALGRPPSTDSCPPSCRPRRRRPGPRPAGWAAREGVLPQVVQHVVLALLLGHRAAGKPRITSLVWLVWGIFKQLCVLLIVVICLQVIIVFHSFHLFPAGIALSGEGQKLPEEERHGRAASHRFRRRRGW